MGSGSSLVSTIQYIGTITNNRQIYDLIPKIIRNKGDLPTFSNILFSNVDLVMVVLSIFITLRILIPRSMILGGFTFWFLIGSFILIPTLLSVILLIVRSFYPKGKGEEGLVVPSISLTLVSLSFFFLLYIAWPLTSITGFDVGAIYGLLWLFVFVPLTIGIVVLSKSIAPIMVLLLGPGIIPHLANQSFFEFCS